MDFPGTTPVHELSDVQRYEIFFALNQILISFRFVIVTPNFATFSKDLLLFHEFILWTVSFALQPLYPAPVASVIYFNTESCELTDSNWPLTTLQAAILQCLLFLLCDSTFLGLDRKLSFVVNSLSSRHSLRFIIWCLQSHWFIAAFYIGESRCHSTSRVLVRTGGVLRE